MKNLRYWPNRDWFGCSQGIAVAMSILLLLLAACLQETSPYSELIRHGFYAYTVANDTLSEREWAVRTPIKQEQWQWNVHCEGGPSAPENPLILYYQDKEGNLQLTIRISDRASPWDHNKPTENVTLNTPWVKGDRGIVYKDQLFSPLRFEDIFGNQVIVRGEQTVAEKINLVNQFEYAGPPVEDAINPWSIEWCTRN